MDLMELKASSPKAAGLSPPDSVSDPEEKEVSDDDDDDRNHKHRRRETRSQSLEIDALERVITRPYRKHNKPFENGHPFRENESQASEKDLSSKFERRRLGLTSLPRSPLDLNQRFRGNQAFSGAGPGRGRGRDSGSWNQRDSRFGSVDIASQMVQQGSIPPNLYNGIGLPNVSNAQSGSWNAFGLIAGLPSGGLDTLHSIGLQGPLGPPINSSMNMGIPRQRCRDFEERGFCLRGDMCPMEHGVNRIVIEDVQSLSQFNLPVSLPSVHLLGTPAGAGPVSSVSASSATLMNSKGLHGKSSKPGMADDSLGLNGAFSGSGCVGGTDLYDPDQPLWNNNCPETSNALLTLQSANDETHSISNDDPSDRHNGRLCDNVDNAVGSQGTSSSVWGRIGTSKNMGNSSDCLENEAKEEKGALACVQGTLRQGKRIVAEDVGLKAMDSSSKMLGDSTRTNRKPSQKALRTLFVNGIPLKSNKREALLSHFQKFGDVIDIYIPNNSERAFVQFSKREEAEAALRAPDAVMGNRFIKLWWANRDSIPDDGISSSSGAGVTPRGPAAIKVPLHTSAASIGKDINQSATPKSSIFPVSDASLPVTENPKSAVSDSPKAPPPLQKKLESLELLKEELRKKQELLDQKRNDFRRQLQKLEKQASGLKGEVTVEQAAKKPKVETVAESTKAAILRSSSDLGSVAFPHAEMVEDRNKSMDNVSSQSPKTSTTVVLQEPMSSKQPIRQSASVGAPFPMNRYKLDNRPTAFRIIPPLPPGLANIAVLKEHFSSFGDLSNVELEGLEARESEGLKNCSACVVYTTRWSAERAFANGKCWQGHNLKFMWLTSNNSRSDPGGSENTPTHEGNLETDAQAAEKLECMVSEEVSASENGDSQNPVRESGVENMEAGEASESGASPNSGEQKSPKGDVEDASV